MKAALDEPFCKNRCHGTGTICLKKVERQFLKRVDGWLMAIRSPWENFLRRLPGELMATDPICPLVALSGHFWTARRMSAFVGKADISDARSKVCL